jgi:hypothetical protein
MDAFQKTAATTEKLKSWKNLLSFFGIGTSFRFLEFKRDTDKLSRETFCKHKEIAHVKKDREGTSTVR